MKAIRVNQLGGPEVLSFEDVPKPKPGPGQVLIKIEKAGVNMIETYFRNGLYKEEVPFTIGKEGAGIVEEVGADVADIAVGDRVASNAISGSYAEYGVAPAAGVIKVPSGVSLEQAVTSIVQGMTAHYLTHASYPIQEGDNILIHAAAGGTGSLVVQLAKMRGAKVIATVSTEEKAAHVKSLGADEVIVLPRGQEVKFSEQVKQLTGGKGVRAVYDSVGKDTWEESLKSLSRFGYGVFFGNSSGPVPPIPPLLLTQLGSIYITRPSLFHHIDTREGLVRLSSDVFKWIQEGKLKVNIQHVFPLSKAKEAHEFIEGRKTQGKLLLDPSL